MLVLLLLLSAISCHLVVGNFCQDPWLICGCNIAEANNDNYCDFLRQMRCKCVDAAVISGWNGCKRKLVLYSDGSNRPYDRCSRVNAAFCSRRRICCQVCYEVGDCQQSLYDGGRDFATRRNIREGLCGVDRKERCYRSWPCDEYYEGDS